MQARQFFLTALVIAAAFLGQALACLLLINAHNDALSLVNQKLAVAKLNVDGQITAMEAMIDERAESDKKYEDRIHALESEVSRLAAVSAPRPGRDEPPVEVSETRFIGVNVRVSFALPEGMMAAEVQNAVYMSDKAGAVSGMIRILQGADNAPLTGEADSLERVYDLFIEQIELADGKAPEYKDIALNNGEGRRFALSYQYEDGSSGCGEICLMRGENGFMCLELEGEEQQRVADVMDRLLADLSL